MNERIPDVIEVREHAAERWADENIRGDRFWCCECEDWKDLSDACATSSDPWSIPVCGECIEEVVRESMGDTE